ncbi:hypothetical protein B0H14DRAFT_3668940, partial [Mycena olivaceomarginata]
EIQKQLAPLPPALKAGWVDESKASQKLQIESTIQFFTLAAVFFSLAAMPQLLVATPSKREEAREAEAEEILLHLPPALFARAPFIPSPNAALSMPRPPHQFLQLQKRLRHSGSRGRMLYRWAPWAGCPLRCSCLSVVFNPERQTEVTVVTSCHALYY